MKRWISIFLFIVGLIVAFWPGAYLLLKIVCAALIFTAAAYPFAMKKNVTGQAVILAGVVVLIFITVNQTSKFDSVEAYMKVTKDSEVRYADVEELSKNFGVEGWTPYFSEWEKKCLANQFDYCRLASYVPRVKKEKRAEELLRIGCTNSDFLSCYNYFFYDEFKTDDRKFAAGVILRSCQGPNLSSEYKVICGRVEQLSKAL